jgi:hypothetical protein
VLTFLAAMTTPYRIHVTSAGAAWRLALDDEDQALFSGEGAHQRALNSALRLAEDLRRTGSVIVVVEHPDRAKSTRIVRSRLAS